MGCQDFSTGKVIDVLTRLCYQYRIMTKILFISYYYAPFSHRATQRILKFTKYLYDFGFISHVITVNPDSVSHISYMLDKELLNEIKGKTHIHYVKDKNLVNWIRNKMTKKKQIPNTSVRPVSSKQSILKKLNKMYQDWFMIPDAFITWASPAVKKGRTLIEKENIKILISTAPPYSSHLIALKLKKQYMIPWIADFRDNWTNSPRIHFPTKFHRIIHKNFEKKIFLNADVITSVQEDVLGKKNLKYMHKLIHLVNGADDSDYNVSVYKKKDKFRMVFTGTLYSNRSPKNIIKALKKIIDEKPLLKNKIELVFYGRCHNIDIDNYAKKAGLSNTVMYKGFIPVKQARLEAMSADVLILILAGGEKFKTVYSGKLFEYLFSKRPILGLVYPHGVAAKIIRETGAGVVVDPDDIISIKKAIYTFYEEWQNDTLVVKGKGLNQYSRYELTRKLASTMTKLLTGKMEDS